MIYSDCSLCSAVRKRKCMALGTHDPAPMRRTRLLENRVQIKSLAMR